MRESSRGARAEGGGRNAPPPFFLPPPHILPEPIKDDCALPLDPRRPHPPPLLRPTRRRSQRDGFFCAVITVPCN
ncbi:hypothetical protein GWI33_017598 [Rhynchophorus ferrugineus]|uniref:Uncharacterized protein n=1 Tax=Rhynchophorus ferrugineus TaxID=354439 RepID=A0A834HY40_RHYFE|nr:hypothetical protein GWI33_017598 [Rhynchophorus ferrugineus]